MYATRDSQWAFEVRFRSVDDDVDHISLTVGILKAL